MGHDHDMIINVKDDHLGENIIGSPAQSDVAVTILDYEGIISADQTNARTCSPTHSTPILTLLSSNSCLVDTEARTVLEKKSG